MSHSLSEDRESHERLLDKEYHQDDEGKGWREDGLSPLRYKKSNFKAAIGITSLAFNVFLALLCIWLWLRSRSPLPPWPNTLYSPAQDAVEYEIVTFNSDFPEDHSGKTAYYGASPSAEAAWKKLMDPYLVQISSAEAARISRPTSQISENPDYYITSLDVYHQLHCLNDIRKMVRDYNTTDGNLGRLQTMHKFHCIDSIRQSLMCNADLSLIHWYWAPQVGKNFPNATTTHICRKWSIIEEWALGHKLDQDDYDPRTHFE
ncbi:Ff.00g038420.m01.CDS01 [Fusarium sp. VM40]|nr:Ff.00g038420.m01.CDS01 [Fusarium sp. VM40]